MQSAIAPRWFGNLPNLLARIFAGHASGTRPATTNSALEPSVVSQRWTGENDGTSAPNHHHKQFRRPEIMVPVDFSGNSEEATEYAIEVARRSGARLVLLHAVHLNLTPYGPANPNWLRAALCREALEKMEVVMTRAQQRGVPVISVIEEGAPARVIAQAAKRWKVSLIVMASRKQGKWARFFGQRILEKVTRGAECAVVVIQNATAKEAKL